VLPKRFLDPGAPLITQAVLMKRATQIKFHEPDKMSAMSLPIGTFARIHSEKGGVYTVWLLDEGNSNHIIVDVPLHLMSGYFALHPHQIFLSIGR
jgi:hypothetical protein